MDLWQVLVIALRRWYVSVPILLLGVFLALQAGDRVNPTYLTTASAVVTRVVPEPPSVVEGQEVDEPSTPAIGLTDTVQTLVVTLNSPPARQQAAAVGASGNYFVEAASRSPVLTAGVETPSVERSLATTQYLLEEMQRLLADNPDLYGLSDEIRYELRVLAEPSLASVLYEGRSRIRVVVLAVSLLLATIAALAVELLLRWLRGRRAKSGVTPGDQGGRALRIEGAERDARAIDPVAR